ncbi:hypothetical protein BMS3Bbin14_01945 [bacterium BMS3Bbin14]|nr:hypothetical protein BMS3Bbin14_01945 [bacterium BMS3Bbin14]
MEIKICGPGCASCKQAQKVVEAAVTARGIEAAITTPCSRVSVFCRTRCRKRNQVI